MSHNAFIRWVRGLIPALILFIVLLVGFTMVWLATVGVPAFLITKIEEIAAAQKQYIKIGGVRVSYFAGFVFKLTDVQVFFDPAKTKSFVSADRVRVDADVDSWGDLLDGHFNITRVSTRNVEVDLPVHPEQKNSEALTLTHFNTNILWGADNMLSIQRAEGLLQGMPFSVSGNYRLPQSDEKNQEKSESFAEQIVQFRQTAKHILDAVNQLHWNVNRPPSWTIQLNEDSQEKLRFEILLKGPSIQYKGLTLRDLMLDITLQDDLLIVNNFQFFNHRKKERCKFTGSVDLARCKIDCALESTIPLLTWANTIAPKPFLPKELILLSSSNVQMELSVGFGAEWKKLKDFTVKGSFQMKEFMLCGEKFSRCGLDLSAKNGKVLINDFQIVHDQGSIQASFLGDYESLQGKLHSTLPIPAVLGVLNGFLEDPIKIPEEVTLQGIPDIHASVHLVGSHPFLDVLNEHVVQEDLHFALKNSRVELVLEDFAVRKVEIGKVTLLAGIDDKTVNIYNLSLERPDGNFHCEGMWADNNLVFKAKNSFPMALWLQALDGYWTQPKEIGMPQQANFDVFGRVEIGKEVETKLLELNLDADLKDFSVRGVSLDSVELKGRYTNVGCLGAKARLETFRLKKGNQELSLFAAGDLQGAVSCTGVSSFNLATMEKLMGLNDDDFFFARFTFSNKSALNVQFFGGLDAVKPLDTYKLELSANLTQTTYQNVLVSSAQTKAEIIPDYVVLSDVVMNVDNAPYLRSIKGKGDNSSVLKSPKISFDFKKNTVKVEQLQSQVYPSYALKMFSPVAAEALIPFKFENTVRITGSGVFPLADDYSLMSSKIHFAMRGGRVSYPLLGTKLVMNRCSGNILISPTWIKVQEFTGLIWGGSFSGAVEAQIDRGNALNGRFQAFGLNLAEIGKSYTTELSPAQVNANIDFTSKNGNVKSIKGTGAAFLQKGNLVEFPLFGEIGNLLSAVIPGLSHLINFNIQEASAKYEIADGFLKTNDFRGAGTNMSLAGSGWMNLDTTNVDINMRMKLRGVTGLLTLPVFLVAGSLFEFEGKGPLSKTKWSMRPFSRKSQQDAKPR